MELANEYVRLFYFSSRKSTLVIALTVTLFLSISGSMSSYSKNCLALEHRFYRHCTRIIETQFIKTLSILTASYQEGHFPLFVQFLSVFRTFSGVNKTTYVFGYLTYTEIDFL